MEAAVGGDLAASKDLWIVARLDICVSLSSPCSSSDVFLSWDASITQDLSSTYHIPRWKKGHQNSHLLVNRLVGATPLSSQIR